MTNLWISGQLIDGLGDGIPEDQGCRRLDVSGCFVTPGLFDLQVNGGKACNFWGDPLPQAVSELARDLAAVGVTSFLPTLISDSLEKLKKNIAALEAAGVEHDRQQLKGSSGRNKSAPPPQPVAGARPGNMRQARMPGIHLEGPFLSPERPGVHPREWIKPWSAELVSELVTENVLLVTLAPETETGHGAIQQLIERNIKVSLGHSNASFDQARSAFDQGIGLVTHTFNALPPLHHRAPGAVGAALLDSRVSCCLICDGLHLDPAVVRLVVDAKGIAKTILVTDAAQIGTSQGGLVGSSITLDQAVRNVVGWAVTEFAGAVRMASYNPACAVGLEHQIGHLAPGRQADVVVWHKDSLAIKHVILGGDLLF